jgi:glutathione S-transferase
MLTLHYYPGNASLTPHMLLEELGVPFQLELVDRAKSAHKTPEYLKLNPNGLIPVLVDGDLVLYETAAICLHLVDTNTMQAMLIHYFYGERLVDAGNVDAAAQVKAHAEAKVGGMLDQLDAELAAHGQPWLLGATFTAVDPYALMLCRWTRGFKRPARSLPHLGPYLQRVLERPAVQRAFDREGLAPPRV